MILKSVRLAVASARQTIAMRKRETKSIEKEGDREAKRKRKRDLEREKERDLRKKNLQPCYSELLLIIVHCSCMSKFLTFEIFDEVGFFVYWC